MLGMKNNAHLNRFMSNVKRSSPFCVALLASTLRAAFNFKFQFAPTSNIYRDFIFPRIYDWFPLAVDLRNLIKLHFKGDLGAFTGSKWSNTFE
mmetsp:Transcript_12849/g.24325  ORF Transcript_12849/g.24325 Transcript_12849/m.24325 type:complete len:93 (+) Transcript_12849:116-394(+)